jgi:hypothetical protein
MVIGVGGILSSHPTADARQYRRSAKPQYYLSPPSPSPNLSGPSLCEKRAQNATRPAATQVIRAGR